MTHEEGSKHKTCKYNSNRHCADIVNPFCNWKPKDENIPPHIMWSCCQICTPEICEQCKCWVAA